MRNYQRITTSGAMPRAALAALALIASVSSAFAQNKASSASAARAQQQEPSTPGQPAPPTLTLQDALARAEKNEPLFLSAVGAAQLAHEDSVQARALLLPSVGLRSEYLGTQGNGILPSGRFVTNDGVHVYRDWGVLHQDLSPSTLMKTGYQRAKAAEAAAQAKAEIARRGLVVTVTNAYYTLLVSQRKYATAQQSLDQAKHFLAMSQDLERGGEVAHSDVLKFQLQRSAQEQVFREAKLAMENARLNLAVLLFSNFDENFQIVDDLNLAPSLPPLTEVQAMAKRKNPDLRAAIDLMRAAKFDVSLARQAFLPTLTVDAAYGIEANAFALHSTVAAFPEAGRLPNLGYFVTASLNLPVWDWGARKSKLRQAEVNHEQARVAVSMAQRQLVKNFSSAYQEAQTAREQVESLRESVAVAAEDLRLNTLSYQAGEATVLALVDAQNTLTQARNTFDDSEVRYRLALANIQTLTGNF